MIFEQFLDEDLGCASYLVGDGDAGVAAVVDPHYAIERIVAAAEQHRVRITRVIETHTHADHVSGHGRLALELDVPVSIHAAAAVDYPHDPLADGDEIDIGATLLRVVHTPGHRPEHCCLVVIDRSRADEPWLVLTGDSLFVGDAARPDLAVKARDGAAGLFHSLQRLMELNDGVEVFPGHVAGSMCGRAMSSKASSTIGFERRFNPALAFSDLDAFVADAAAVTAPKPPNLVRIVELNHGPFVAGPAPLVKLTAPPEDTQLLDVRAPAAHLAGHLLDAVNVPVASKGFGSRAGFVLDSSRGVTLIAATEAEAVRAAQHLRSVAILALDGFLLGAGDEHADPVGLDELAGLMQAGAELIDVREKDERDTGYIPGSRNVPYRLLTMCCPDLPADRPVVTICESGTRAAIASSILRARGYDARPILVGGVAGWRERGGDMVTFRRCGADPDD